MFTIRIATPEDAEELIAVLEQVALEGIYTAITKPWSAAEQRRHMMSFSAREVIHVAVARHNAIIGYQVLELWAPTLESMAHVGHVGTFVEASWRGQGVGAALFKSTVCFARASGYSKFVIQVRSRNTAAQSFYRRRGFVECGRLSRQVRAGGDEDDEVLMEYFLP